MRVVVTGGREIGLYDDRMWIYAGLDLLHERRPITELIEGGAPGFDLCCKNWVLWRQGCGDTIKLTTVRAQWELHGRAAGPLRNVKMAEMKPDLVFAGPGGTGTQHMVDTAKAHGLGVVFLEKMPVVRASRLLEAQA